MDIARNDFCSLDDYEILEVANLFLH